MNVLVAGAKGFIAQHLMANVGAYKWLPVSRDTHYQSKCIGDFSEFTEWEQVFVGADVVVHLAARVHSKGKQTSGVYDRDNCATVETMALAAIKAGVKRFIFLSSIKVNGEGTNDRKPYSAYEAPVPVDPYGYSKAKAETMLLDLAKSSSLEVVIIRPPLVYGPQVKANFRALMRLADSPCPLPFAGVDNRRDMVSIDNLCDLITRSISTPEAANKILMVSDGEPYSLATLIATMREVNGRPRRLFYLPVGLIRIALRLLGKKHIAERLLGNLEVDISETAKILDWQPKVSLRETLHKMNSREP
ncbi:MAG: UDP-glucose 4-epimerase [Pseudohongiellaceae bacterium]|jgi:UDP-glucose 4-epimerase